MAINLEVTEGKAEVLIYATSSFKGVTVQLKGLNKTYLVEVVDISPVNTYNAVIDVDKDKIESNFKLTVKAESKELISYKPKVRKNEHI